MARTRYQIPLKHRLPAFGLLLVGLLLSLAGAHILAVPFMFAAFVYLLLLLRKAKRADG
jgi:hypothetical protein